MQLDNNLIRKNAQEYWKNVIFKCNKNENTENKLLLSNDEIIKYIYELQKLRENLYDWSNNMKLNDKDFWSNKKVLDFGCGTGVESVTISKNNPELITVADIVESNVIFASRCLNYIGQKNNTIFWNNIKELEKELKEKNFLYDIIYSPGVLHHIPDIKEIIIILNKFLKVNGVFHIMLYSKNGFHKLYNLNIITGDKRGLANKINGKETFSAEGPYSRCYDLEEVQELFGINYKIIYTNEFNENKFVLYQLKKIQE